MTFFPAGRDVPVRTETSILELALLEKIDIDHSCGGMGSCGTCLIVVEKGLEKMAPRNEVETEMALDRGFRDNERLACQNECFEGLVVRIPNRF